MSTTSIMFIFYWTITALITLGFDINDKEKWYWTIVEMILSPIFIPLLIGKVCFKIVRIFKF